MEGPGTDRIIYWPLGLKFWRFGARYAQGPISGGLREGPWTFWYKSGIKQMAGCYKGGRKDGPWTKWWENGQAMSQGCFAEGRMHGPWTDWFANGNKAQETFWDHGAPCGETVVYDARTGQVARRVRQDREGQGGLEGRGKPRPYTLMTDRDMAWAVVRAQRAILRRSWARLVGAKTARLLEPWQGALWLILLIPAYKIIEPQFGLLAVPMAAVAASLVCTGAVFLTFFHEQATRPDSWALED